MHKDNSTMSPNPNYLNPEEGEILLNCIHWMSCVCLCVCVCVCLCGFPDRSEVASDGL